MELEIRKIYHFRITKDDNQDKCDSDYKHISLIVKREDDTILNLDYDQIRKMNSLRVSDFIKVMQEITINDYLLCKIGKKNIPELDKELSGMIVMWVYDFEDE